MRNTFAISMTYDIFVALLLKANSISKRGQKCQIIFKILTLSARNLLLKICANLIGYLKNIITSADFLSHHRQSEKDFTRERILPFYRMIFFLINLIKRSIQDELDYFFKAIYAEDVATRKITKSAFSKARKKLHHQAFIELGRHLASFFYEHFPCRKWKGFRILAIDGSTAKVPRSKDCTDHFGACNTAKGEVCPIARISSMFDVLNGITVDALIGPKEQGERAFAPEHMQHLKDKDNNLVLLDRGYPAFWLFSLILSRQAHFCIRINDRWNEIRKFLNSEEKDDIISITPSSASIKQCNVLNLPFSPLYVRALRIELVSGETEILLTSLMDKNIYPYEIFKELYHLRWPTEENYKAVKCRIEIENFSGKSAESVYQDFHAKVFAMNLTAAISHQAQNIITEQCVQKNYSYRINFTQALSKMKDVIVLLFSRSNIIDLLERLHTLFIATIEPVQAGQKVSTKKWLSMYGLQYLL